MLQFKLKLSIFKRILVISQAKAKKNCLVVTANYTKA